MRRFLEFARSRRRLTWLLSGLTLPVAATYNYSVHGFSLVPSIGFALASAAFVWVFFWFVLKSTSLPD